MWPFKRKPKPACPRCGHRDHTDPNVHNTLITQAAEVIAKARTELALMDPGADNRARIGYLNSRITAQLNWTEEQLQYADAEYQDLDHLITLAMQRA